MNNNTAGVLIILIGAAFLGGLATLDYLNTRPKPTLTVETCINWMSIQARELGQPTTGIKERCKELFE